MRVLFEDQLAEENTRRPNVSAVDKAFLKFVYGSVVTVADQNKYKFDVEHLFPVQRLLDLSVTNGEGGWTIGSMANLALLDRATNRRKKGETISEYFARPATGMRGGPSRQEKALIESFLFCDPNAVSIPVTAGRDDLKRGAYVAFLEDRWKQITSALYKALGIP